MTAGVTDWQSGAAPRSTLRSASADLQQAQGERALLGDGGDHPHPNPLPSEGEGVGRHATLSPPPGMDSCLGAGMTYRGRGVGDGWVVAKGNGER